MINPPIPGGSCGRRGEQRKAHVASEEEVRVKLHVRPLTLREGNELVSAWHRHHKPVQGHRFSLGVFDEEGVPHGAAIVGRPTSRGVHPYAVAEVTRLVTDGTRNACSMLYAAVARAAAGMGFERVQTYILASEYGTSLRASGWQLDGHTSGRSWSCPSRPRTDKHPTEDKQRWVKHLNRAWAL
ncbi:XF1762 family protein [Streptomyces spectabilis]|uniref:XF1762 family protein n=1 Tax=Streptomyces spectabilis TaxID=68270 RepID=UPI0033FDE1E2